MKVLNIMSRFNVGGTSQWLYQLSIGLSENKIDNLLVIGECPANEKEDIRLKDLNHLKVDGLGPKTSIFSTVQAFLRLRKIIKEYSPEIINTHTSKAGVIGRLASKSVKGKSKIVHTYHGHVLTGYFNKVIELGIQSVEILLSLVTDYFLVSGEKVLSDIKKAKIIRGSNFITVWPAVPDYSLNNREELRRSHGIEPEKIVIGWLGRKVPIKRIDRILEVASQIPDAIFLIAGDGESIKQTYSKYFQNGQLTNVKELGFSTPSDIWSMSDIAVLTSDNEAMPISPIEAALGSLPVVAIDAGATSEVVLDGLTGFLCSKKPEEFAATLKTLVRDASMRSKLGEAGRKLALSRFSPESSVQRQIQGYRAAQR